MLCDKVFERRAESEPTAHLGNWPDSTYGRRVRNPNNEATSEPVPTTTHAAARACASSTQRLRDALPGPSLRPKSQRGRIAWIVSALLLLAIATSVSCSDNSPPDCGPDGLCSCHDGEDCFLGCYADNCNLDCHNTRYACGTICYDDCIGSCHDTHECSHSCQNGCTLACHNTDECSGICGANCNYTCHDTQTCGVRVGPHSTVTCTNMTTCAVECEGDCDVNCTALVNCNVTCLAGDRIPRPNGGRISCQGNP
ncbi:MAG TPA: hypothetical protein VIV60_05510 [Polyangiaceae bacterium]